MDRARALMDSRLLASAGEMMPTRPSGAPTSASAARSFSRRRPAMATLQGNQKGHKDGTMLWGLYG